MEAASTAISCTEVWGDNRAVATALSLPGLEGWVYARPYHGQEAGGDVHYVSSCGTGRIARLLLADVSGHGEAVAATSDRLRRLMQRYMNHIHPGALAKQLNHDIGAVLDDEGRFATAVVMTFFSPDGGLSICNAGHPPPLLFRRATGRWSPIDQPDTRGRIANLPLGVLETSGYEGRELTLEPGDVLFVYTDCLIEAKRNGSDRDAPMLDVDGLVALLNEDVTVAANSTGAATAASVVDGLLGELASQGYALEDDVTAVALCCTQRINGRGWLSRAAGLGRAFAMAGGAVLGRGPIPWPEVSVPNLWGGLWPKYRRKTDG